MFSKEQLLEVFKSTAGKGVVFRYKGDPPFSSDTHHIFIILYKIPETGELLLVNGSSKYDKILKTLNRMGLNPNETLVCINPGEYDFFPLKTAIDCNTVHEFSLDSLKIEDFEYVIGGEIHNSDMDKIIQGIKNSSSIPPRIKELLN